jgi:outer membrane lipoprotein-sorting protein
VVQEWLIDNKLFIESQNKAISFEYSISHPELKGELKTLKGQLITASKGRFKLELGPRTIYSDGDVWISYDSRTNQAIIQNPDSISYNSIITMTHYFELNKMLSLSVLKNNTATLYNKGQKIDINFKDKKIKSIISEYNSVKVEIMMIKFETLLVISDSLFVFDPNSTMMIDLRE